MAAIRVLIANIGMNITFCLPDCALFLLAEDLALLIIAESDATRCGFLLFETASDLEVETTGLDACLETVGLLDATVTDSPLWTDALICADGVAFFPCRVCRFWF
jgi:hypothetical protein